MKGLISGIKRMEIHDGDGIRTTVFFKGCPLKCIWCHNPESISYEKQIAYFQEKCIGCGICKNERNETAEKNCPVGALILYGKEYEADILVEELLQDKPFFVNSGGGITFSGGESLSQPDFAIEVARKLCENAISVYVDTCGHVKREIFEKIVPYTDKFLYDIKAIDAVVHKKCTGKDNKIILDNLKYLSDIGCKIEIRYPLIKGYNDGECEKIGEFLSELTGVSKVKVLKYHSLAGSRYKALKMENTLPENKTTDEDINRAIKILQGYGLNAII